ncbi:hypothetical protein ABFV05_020298 [Capra hircus]
MESQAEDVPAIAVLLCVLIKRTAELGPLLTMQLVSTIGQASCGVEGWLIQGFLTGRRGADFTGPAALRPGALRPVLGRVPGDTTHEGFWRPLRLSQEEMKQPPPGAHNFPQVMLSCLGSRCPVLQREIDNLKDQLVVLQRFTEKFQTL